MSFKDFLKNCSEEITSGDIATTDSCLNSVPEKPKKEFRKKPKKEFQEANLKNKSDL